MVYEGISSEQQIVIFKDTIMAMVRQDSPDLSARQLSVFLVCYLNDTAQTVRGLAATLDVSKPAITRALDRLEGANLVSRKTDPNDRRSVLLQRTAAGSNYLKNIKHIIDSAFKQLLKKA